MVSFILSVALLGPAEVTPYATAAATKPTATATTAAAATATTVEVAPAPRPVCEHRGSADCLCPNGDLRCRARAALSLAAAANRVSPAVPAPTPPSQPLTKEQIAARKALSAAEMKIKASKQ